MSAARPLFRLAIVPALLLTGAAQGQDHLQQLQAVIQHPVGIAVAPNCPLRITEALGRERVPDFRKIAYDLARRCAGYLKLSRNDRPDPSAPAGTVFDQDPAAGVSVPGDRTVALFVSTGPPPAPQPPPPAIATQTCPNGATILATETCPGAAQQQPAPISGVQLANAEAVAGTPLRFTVTMGPNGTGGQVRFATLGGDARPQVDYEPVRGDLTLSPASQPVVIEVATHQASDAPVSPRVLMVLMAGKQVLARAVGTILQPAVQPAPPAPPPGGAAAPSNGVATISAETVVAPNPLHFRIGFQAGTPGEKASYYTEGGSAKPGVDYGEVRGEVTVDPTTGMQVVEVPTQANPNAGGDLTVGLVVLANDEVLARAFGTIRQPVTPLPPPPSCVTGNEPACPCTTGNEPSCPPPRRCEDGSLYPCKTWPTLPDLLPFLVIGASFGLGAAAVSRVWPRPKPPNEPQPGPENGSEPPQLSDFSFDVKTPRDAAPPRVTSPPKGPKSPIISLAVKTTREEARIIAATRPEDGENG